MVDVAGIPIAAILVQALSLRTVLLWTACAFGCLNAGAWGVFGGPATASLHLVVWRRSS
jgi:hypothetical protein